MGLGGGGLDWGAMACVTCPRPRLSRARASAVKREARAGAVRARRLPRLHRLARRGDAGAIARLLEDERDVDARDGNGSTALMHAVERRRGDAAAVLIEAGASPTCRNLFGWSSWEYGCEAEAAGVLAPFLDAAAAALSTTRADRYASDARRTRNALLAAGAEPDGCTAITYGPTNAHVRIVRDNGATLEVAAAERKDGAAAARYAFGAAKSTIDAVRGVAGVDPSAVVVGGQAVPGVTSRRMGMYAGVRYRVGALEWRPAGARYAHDEPRVSATRLDDAPPPPSSSPTGAWEMVAELSHPACTPWGATEVDAQALQLHSIASEFRESLKLGAVASLLPVLVTIYAIPFRLVSVDGLSMLPTLHPSEVVLVDTRRAAVQSSLEMVAEGSGAPVVWVDVPDALRAIAVKLGRPPPPRGAKLFKRLVAAGGDTVAIADGAVVVNGVPRERVVCDEAGCKAGIPELEASVVPDGGVYVVGDNRGKSSDSTLFGPVSERSMRGRARAVVLPLGKARLL